MRDAKVTRRQLVAGTASAVALTGLTRPTSGTRLSALAQTEGPAAPIDPTREGWHGLAFIGGGESNKLWVLDARHHKLVTALDVGGPYVERTDPQRYPNLRDAHAMAFTKDFTEYFTVDSWEYGVAYAIKYDPTTFREIARCEAGEGGHHCALSPDDTYLYVANQYGTTISVIDRVSMTKVKDLEVGEGSDYISPSMYWDGKAIETPYLFVSADKVPAVVAFDWQTNEVVKTFPVSGGNHGTNLTPDGTQVWCAVPGGGECVIIDVAGLEVIQSLKLIEDGGPIHIVFSPDGAHAYMSHTSPEGLFLLKIDTQTYEEVWRAPGSGAHLGCAPDGKEVWTLNHTFDQNERYPYLLGGQPLSAVRVFDTENGDWIAEMIFERRPHEIQFVPYSAVGIPEPEETEQPSGTPVAADVHVVQLVGKDDLFLPNEITVVEGEKVRFEIDNQDTYDHIFGPGDERLTDTMETITLPASQVTTYDWVVSVPPGEYKLICGIHPGMDILMTVEAGQH
jgi:YVTN family beta-propeller protein